MKSLAELKRIIKPGIRLRCIVNTYRPVLNGQERIVCRVQTNAFTWKPANPPTHTLISGRSAAKCSCGGWSLTKDYERWMLNASEEVMREVFEKHFAGHQQSAARESWTNYPKASLFRFDGSNTFEIKLSETDDHLYIRLEVLPNAK